MIIVRRDNNSLRCKIVGERTTWRELSIFLKEIKEAYEKEGWSTCWDNDHLQTGLLTWKDQESLFFGPYFRRTPRDVSREFVW